MVEHHVHVGSQLMAFRGLAVPRAGDTMRLLSPNQKIDGVYQVVDVRWAVTNRQQGSSRYTSEAQAEIWVEPYQPPRKKSWARTAALYAVIALTLIAVGYAVAYEVLT